MHGEPQKLLFPSIEEIKKRLARRLSPYSQPVPLTCFSYDDQRRLLVQDSSQLVLSLGCQVGDQASLILIRRNLIHPTL